MKKPFLLTSVYLILICGISFAQAPVIDFETVGNDWSYGLFGQGSSTFDIVANPDPSGINTSDSVAAFIIAPDAEGWAGVFSGDFPDLILDSTNCTVTVMVWKDVISDFNLKLEPPNVDQRNIKNTVTGQWELLTFDYSAYIGTTVATLTILPDHVDARTAGSINYYDNITFSPRLPSQQVTNTINFTADLSAIIGSGAGFFDPAQDSLVIVGLDWDGLGTVLSGQRTMTQQGTSATFTTSLVVQSTGTLTAGDSTKWQAKGYPDSRFVNGGWESTGDRWLIYQADGATVDLPTFQPNIDPIPAPTGTYTIEFIADINNILNIGAGGAFDPNQDSLMLMGLDWEGGSNVIGSRKLQNLNPFNPGEYTTTLTVDATGDSTKWKFKAEPGNRFSNDGWEAGNDNWFVYGTETSVTIGPVVPRIFPLFPPIPSDVNLTFNVDMTGAINQWNGLPIPLNEIEFVGLRGGADFLGNWSSGCWCPTDTTTGNMKVLTDMGNNMYQYNTIVPAGTNGGNFEYKFAVMYPGADTINGGSQPLDNEGGFGRNHAFILSGQELTVVNNNQWGVFTPTDVERIEDLTPYAYQLEQNYPNPFNPSTVIKYSIPEAGFVTLKVFNLLGQEVATLVNNEQATGVYQATFDASQLSSGIYFYSLETKNFTSTKKMLLMK